MKKITVVFLCLLAACGGGGGGGGSSNLSRNACSVLGLGTKSIGSKIIDGSACQSAASPVVAYEVQYSDSSVTGCTGTLVTPTRILTAGHCFESVGLPVTAIAVSVGGQIVAGTTYAVHPSYREDVSVLAIFNDVAVIGLDQAVSVATLPLVTSGPLVSGDVISIFGYGLDNNGDTGELRSGQMEVGNVTSDHVFAAFNGEGSNTCQGDSGGPAVSSVVDGNGVARVGIAGLTSTGIASSNCLEGDVSLFANVQNASNLAFILAAAPGVGQI